MGTKKIGVDTPQPGLDPKAWIERHGDALFRYALIHLYDRAQAEDLVQETFLAALKARERYAGRSSERGWLLGILKHKIMDEYRRRGREQPLPESDHEIDALFLDNGRWREGPSAWPDPERAFENDRFIAALRECLETLPGRQGEVFVLIELDGLGTEAVCKDLEITSTNLWVMMHRARLQLRQCIERHGFGMLTC